MTQLVLFDYQQLDIETRIVVQQRTSEIKTLVRRSAQDIREIGDKLIETKELLGHGHFGAWLETEFGWTHQTAINFMRVASKFKNFLNLDDVAPSALYLLSAPSTPETARDEAIQRAQGGETITHSKAKEIVDSHKNSRFICQDCGEVFSTEVWHCPYCDHHWRTHHRNCPNCYKDKPTAKESADAKRLAQESPEIFERVRSGEITIPKAKQEIARQNKPEPTETPPLPNKQYRCIVIDPPWPIRKIEREERPNQGIALDYPIMSVEEIALLPVGDLAHSGGCHLYLWVTQKYLPEGLWIVKHWGFKYQCLFTWRKNVGMTPYSWMYDTEHVIFARYGNLPLKRLGLRLSFDARTRGHSVKPDVFYTDRVLLASPEPRLEMFARRERKGFEVWGNEV